MSDLSYFAYGSNLAKDQMKERTGPIREARRAWIDGYRVAFNKRGDDGLGRPTSFRTRLGGSGAWFIDAHPKPSGSWTVSKEFRVGIMPKECFGYSLTTGVNWRLLRTWLGLLSSTIGWPQAGITWRRLCGEPVRIACRRHTSASLWQAQGTRKPETAAVRCDGGPWLGAAGRPGRPWRPNGHGLPAVAKPCRTGAQAARPGSGG